jgi:predicted nucleotidyltransferase component of viral defense system
MPAISIGARLKRRDHRSVALAQDVMVAQAYDAFPDCVLHGGTAIWRCYGGGRFSEDVDVYLPTYDDLAETRFRRGVVARGLEELKFKRTETTVFGKFGFSGAVVSFEGALRAPSAGTVRPYETIGGGFMLVRTLPPEALVAEKAAAYVARRKVRDLYDVFFLLSLVEDRRAGARGLAPLLRGYGTPEDEASLRAVVVAGAVPSADEMMEAVRKWARRSTSTK